MRRVRVPLSVLVLVLSAMALSGCTTWQGGVGGFLRSRLKDTMEMADIGVTVTETPQFSFYAAVVSAVPFGYGKVDGTFYGMGGGDIGAMKIHYEHWGAGLIGHETTGWGNSIWDFPEFDPAKPETMNCQGVGIGGFISPPYDARPGGRPTCTKYLHLGYVGIVANACFAQMVDAMAGWVGLDPAGDDDPACKYGKWPWEEPWSAPKEPAAK